MHVAATYDGTTIKLYVNGVQEGVQLCWPSAIMTNNSALGIGAQPDGATQLQGALDDTLLYNSALTAAEVAGLAGITPPNTPPTLNPIGNKNAQVGTQLAFTATATDPDAGTTLTYSLADGHRRIGSCGRRDRSQSAASPGLRPPASWAWPPSTSA